MVHGAGGLLNALVLTLAAVWLVRHRELAPGAWWEILLGLLAATFLADLVSGLLHWAFDTWFSEDKVSLRRMVLIVREHHLRPARIFKYRFRDEAGLLSWFGLLVAAPWLAAGMATSRIALVVLGIGVSLQIVSMLEFHKWGHRIRRTWTIRALQRAGLLLSPDFHMRHHEGEHDKNYCLINGMADRTLGRLGMYRALERAIEALTGARARENDHVWAARYGRMTRDRT